MDTFLKCGFGKRVRLEKHGMHYIILSENVFYGGNLHGRIIGKAEQDTYKYPIDLGNSLCYCSDHFYNNRLFTIIGDVM